MVLRCLMFLHKKAKQRCTEDLLIELLKTFSHRSIDFRLVLPLVILVQPREHNYSEISVTAGVCPVSLASFTCTTIQTYQLQQVSVRYGVSSILYVHNHTNISVTAGVCPVSLASFTCTTIQTYQLQQVSVRCL